MSTTATCTNCETHIERVGPTLWVHKPSPGSYKVACPGMWGKTAKPAPEVHNA